MTELITSEEVWEGETVLYCVVERVGGKEPKARIRLSEKGPVTVAVDIPGKRLRIPADRIRQNMKKLKTMDLVTSHQRKE